MGWNGSGMSKAGEREIGKPHLRRDQLSPANPKRGALILFLIGVIITFLAIWWMTSRSGKNDLKLAKTNTPKPTLIMDAKPSVPTNYSKAAAKSDNKNARMERGVEVVAAITRTNQSGVVIEKLTLADGRKVEKFIPPKPIFDNVSDQMIALALSTKPGQSMPPLPSLGNIDQEFAKSLLSPIKIEEDDSEEVRDLKLSVKEARSYIVAEIKAGGSMVECLQDYRNRMEDISDRHTMAVQEIRKMTADGATKEEIRTFRSRINEIFRERGIPELSDRSKK